MSNLFKSNLDPRTTITGKSSTIAKAIRDHLDLDPSDRIKFSLHPDSGVDPTQDLDLGVEGASSISGPPRSFDAMETATTGGAAD
jgi:hypothetical protein